jgi:hypothetical protein
VKRRKEESYGIADKVRIIDKLLGGMSEALCKI